LSVLSLQKRGYWRFPLDWPSIWLVDHGDLGCVSTFAITAVAHRVEGWRQARKMNGIPECG
jgi:hypothetical protein